MKRFIVLIFCFMVIVFVLSYLVFCPSFTFDSKIESAFNYLKYEDDLDLLYQEIYDFISENDDILIGVSSYNMSDSLDENYDYMVRVAGNYILDHAYEYDISNNMISLEEIYKITDTFFDKRDFYLDTYHEMVELDFYEKRFSLDISDMDIIRNMDNEVLVFVCYDNGFVTSSFYFSFGCDGDRLYVRNIEVASV